MIFLALFGGLATAKRWGYAAGVLAVYVLYIAYSLWLPLGLALTVALFVVARGIAADRLTLYALAASYGKFLLLPFLMDRPIPYYEALWYAAQVSPYWRTYAPLTYLPSEPPLELALEGTLFAAGAMALASRALAEVLGPQAVLWPLLAPEPVWFGQFDVALPLAWIAAYYAIKRRAAPALASTVLAAGFHIYAGAVSVVFLALYGMPWALLLALPGLLTPESRVLLSLAQRIPGENIWSVISAVAFRADPLWYAKIAVELVVGLGAAALAGRAALLVLLGFVGSILTARAPQEFAGFFYRHILAVLPFSRPGRRTLIVLAALSLFPYVLQVHYFGLSWSWALRYAAAFASGRPIVGPIEQAYRMIYK